MISNLSKLTAKTHPSFLKTLQRIYLIRSKVFTNKNLEEQNLDSVFNNINHYQDGKGLAITNKFDELFSLHKNYPKKQYELLNTSYCDSIYISSYLEVKNYLKMINFIFI
jgi:hypothetical protein